MEKVIRFGVSMPKELLKKFDQLIIKKGYPNRSEAFRDIIRNRAVEEEWETGEKEIVGTVTIVYSHDTGEINNTLVDLQHKFHPAIISSMHVHLDEHNCLEVLVVKGKSKSVKQIAEKLISCKGVKHGHLTMTTSGKGLS